jgi:hypothetical protein
LTLGLDGRFDLPMRSIMRTRCDNQFALLGACGCVT